MSVEEYQKCVLTPSETYHLIEYKDEKELGKYLFEKAKDVFGESSIYIPIEQKLQRSLTRTRFTDGLVLDLNDRKNPKFWLVEHELSKHDPDTHIAPQIRGFIKSLDREETITLVAETVYKELRNNPKHHRLAKKVFGNEEVYRGLRKLLQTNCGIIIVIDKVTLEIDDLQKDLSAEKETRLIEFKTYKNDGKTIHAFTPLNIPSSLVGIKKKTYFTKWEEFMEWTSPETKEFVTSAIPKIASIAKDISHVAKYKWYYFYANKEMDRHGLFGVILLRKKGFELRLFLPHNFTDPDKISQQYKGWFWHKTNGLERGIKIRREQELERATSLIRQAYNHAMHRIEVHRK